MGCQISNQAFIILRISLNTEFFKQSFVSRLFQRISTISFIVKELKSELLKDHINPNKLKIRVSYMKKLYSGSSQQTLDDINVKNKDEVHIICKELEYETIQLRIKAPNSSRIILLNLSKDRTILELVEKLKQIGIFSGNFQLVWKDILLDEMNKIDSYNIEPGDMLNIMCITTICARSNLYRDINRNINLQYSTAYQAQDRHHFRI